jgi:hypothetical protein
MPARASQGMLQAGKQATQAQRLGGAPDPWAGAQSWAGGRSAPGRRQSCRPRLAGRPDQPNPAAVQRALRKGSSLYFQTTAAYEVFRARVLL